MHFDPLKEKEILDFLETKIGFENYGVVFDRGLERIRGLFNRFQNLNSKIITIAGTNGKGQTARLISQGIANNQKTFCRWTSPHLLSITQRFSSEQGDITYDSLSKLFSEVYEIQNKEGILLSFYEFLFFSFCLWAWRKNPDFLVLEVGLGGRLDAVNLFNTDCAVLCSIGRDHQEFLGNSLKSILDEKLGIARKGSPLIFAEPLEYLKMHAKVKFSDEIILIDGSESDFNERNKLSAQMVLTHFELKAQLEITNQTLSFGKIVLDYNGAHNPHAMSSMIYSLCRQKKTYQKIFLGLSKRPIADIRSMLKALCDFGRGRSEIFLIKSSHFKSLSQSELNEIAKNFDVKLLEDWQEYLASEKNKEQNILVTGSNYLIGDLQKFLYLQGK
jgi:dihydrofolate synthase/folylpolyglutamate synthase